ncbi:hypothetical protein ACQ4LE_003460 [Meloidogyne hapla]
MYQISNQPPPIVYTGIESEKNDQLTQQNTSARKAFLNKPATVPNKTRESPLLIVLQKALPLDKNTTEEHKTLAHNILRQQQNIPDAKQILFLDDYEENMGDDDYKENDEKG